MARPRGRTKTARISVSFEPDVYGRLLHLAKRLDVPVAQIIRRAVVEIVVPKSPADRFASIQSAETTGGT